MVWRGASHASYVTNCCCHSAGVRRGGCVRRTGGVRSSYVGGRREHESAGRAERLVRERGLCDADDLFRHWFVSWAER